MATKYKFEVGQKVIYDGVVGIIESRSVYLNGKHYYGLIAEADEQMSCTADEDKCELFAGQEIDQREALLRAYINSAAIQETVSQITDKHFRDGCH